MPKREKIMEQPLVLYCMSLSVPSPLLARPHYPWVCQGLQEWEHTCLRPPECPERRKKCST